MDGFNKINKNEFLYKSYIISTSVLICLLFYLKIRSTDIIWLKISLLKFQRLSNWEIINLYFLTTSYVSLNSFTTYVTWPCIIYFANNFIFQWEYHTLAWSVSQQINSDLSSIFYHHWCSLLIYWFSFLSKCCFYFSHFFGLC